MRILIGVVAVVALAGGIFAANVFAGLSIPLLYAGVGLIAGLATAIDAHRKNVETKYPKLGLPPIGVFAIVAYGWPVALPFYLHMTRPAPQRPPSRVSTSMNTPRASAAMEPPRPSGSMRRIPAPSFTRVSTATVLVGAFALFVPVAAGVGYLVQSYLEVREGDQAVTTGLVDECLAVTKVTMARFGIMQLQVHRAVGVTSDMYEPASRGIARATLAAHPDGDRFRTIVVLFMTFRDESSLEPDSVAASFMYSRDDLATDDSLEVQFVADDAHARRFIDLVMAGDTTAISMLPLEQQATDSTLADSTFRAQFVAGTPQRIVRSTCGSFVEPYGARRQRYVMHYPDRREIFDVQVVGADSTLGLVGYRHFKFDNAVLEIR